MHTDVFDMSDISMVEAERDVIVNRAIASGLVPVRSGWTVRPRRCMKPGELLYGDDW